MGRFDGQPRLILTPNGSTITYVGGQPIMDEGWENYILIRLFTGEGWAGNTLLDDPNQRVGSDFEEESSKPITVASLNNTNEAAERALQPAVDNGLFSSVRIETTNPDGFALQVKIFVIFPGGDTGILILTKNSLNWIAQKINPAHKRTI